MGRKDLNVKRDLFFWVKLQRGQGAQEEHSGGRSAGTTYRDRTRALFLRDPVCHGKGT